MRRDTFFSRTPRIEFKLEVKLLARCLRKYIYICVWAVWGDGRWVMVESSAKPKRYGWDSNNYYMKILPHANRQCTSSFLLPHNHRTCRLRCEERLRDPFFVFILNRVFYFTLCLAILDLFNFSVCLSFRMACCYPCRSAPSGTLIFLYTYQKTETHIRIAVYGSKSEKEIVRRNPWLPTDRLAIAIPCAVCQPFSHTDRGRIKR